MSKKFDNLKPFGKYLALQNKKNEPGDAVILLPEAQLPKDSVVVAVGPDVGRKDVLGKQVFYNQSKAIPVKYPRYGEIIFVLEENILAEYE